MTLHFDIFFAVLQAVTRSTLGPNNKAQCLNYWEKFDIEVLQCIHILDMLIYFQGAYSSKV